MGLWEFLFGSNNDDEWQPLEVPDRKEEGEWQESVVDNDESSEEGAPYHDEHSVTGDGGDEEMIDVDYTNMQETLQQPKLFGGFFDWIFGN
jgi:hypothetical protein